MTFSIDLDIMSSVTDKPPAPLSEQALRQFIAKALEKGYFGESTHASDDHPERNISVDDVLWGLEQRDWTIAKDPDYDGQHKNWEYLIRTVDLEGKLLRIKIAVDLKSNRIKVVSRW